MSVVLRRIYNEEKKLGGYRVLIDRIWPRGISKEQAEIDEWMKDLSPSPDLRKWFNHEPAKFEEFKKQYRQELNDQPEKKSLLNKLREQSEGQRVVLLFGAGTKPIITPSF
ncbi:DUF488 domain-containing protein [Halobacillus andaensis]|uniref:DUF488 domain-containing protein n=1 Tax=Halobacillus andaensis TaxID=1176239 RepID=UPI003D7453E4